MVYEMGAEVGYQFSSDQSEERVVFRDCCREESLDRVLEDIRL